MMSVQDGSITFEEVIHGFRTMPGEETGKPKDIEATLAAQSEEIFNESIGFLTRLADAFGDLGKERFELVREQVTPSCYCLTRSCELCLVEQFKRIFDKVDVNNNDRFPPGGLMRC